MSATDLLKADKILQGETVLLEFHSHWANLYVTEMAKEDYYIGSGLTELSYFLLSCFIVILVYIINDFALPVA